MLNFKKLILIKIISCIVIVTFLSNEAAYSLSLRAPVGNSNARINYALGQIKNEDVSKDLTADPGLIIHASKNIRKQTVLKKVIVFCIVFYMLFAPISFSNDSSKANIFNKSVEAHVVLEDQQEKFSYSDSVEHVEGIEKTIRSLIILFLKAKINSIVKARDYSIAVAVVFLSFWFFFFLC